MRDPNPLLRSTVRGMRGVVRKEILERERVKKMGEGDEH
jgi:hypothetical protein